MGGELGVMPASAPEFSAQGVEIQPRDAGGIGTRLWSVMPGEVFTSSR